MTLVAVGVKLERVSSCCTPRTDQPATTLYLARYGLGDSLGSCDSAVDLSYRLGSYAELSGYVAIQPAKNSGVRQLWRCRFESQAQNEAPDCENENNARFHNLSREILPPKPKKNTEVPEAASRIRELRESRGESQTAFARALGTLPSAVSKWEGGRNQPQPAIFARLATMARGAERDFFRQMAGVGAADLAAIRPPVVDAVRWDREVLREAVEWLDEELKKRRKRRPEGAEYAATLAAFYERLYNTRKWDSAFAEKQLRIA